MANEFFIAGADFIEANRVRAYEHNAKFAAVETGFDSVSARIAAVEASLSAVHNLAQMTYAPDSTLSLSTEWRYDDYFKDMVLNASTNYIVRCLQIFSSAGSPTVKSSFATSTAITKSDMIYEWRDDGGATGGAAGNLVSGIPPNVPLTPGQERKYLWSGMIATGVEPPTLQLRFAQGTPDAEALIRLGGFVEFTEVK